MRYAASVEYEGTDFCGWQRQSSVKSIQEEIEKAISEIIQTPVEIQGAGRTDAGVHAFLPDSIRIKWIRKVSDEFHARFSATSREYQYLLNSAPINSSIWANHCGWTFYELNYELLKMASKKFKGRHDFSAFRSSECQAKSPIRTIKAIKVKQFNSFYLFSISGDGFLHHQIRNMIATIINVGRNEMDLDYIDILFKKKDRSLTPATFSPNGLYLTNIKYDKIWGFPDTLNTLNIFKA
jgi:tRNA pseudouridine38-40 synthase